MTGTAKYRFPGPQEFEDTPTDSRRFFGRSAEISTVVERIVASRLLVVYGGSGLGKSSLLKAGVFPKLRSESLLPIRVRLNKPGGSVLELLRDACAETARNAGREFGIDYTPGQGHTAWEFFRTVMFWRGERLVLPVLVFDQFEELFTLADAAWRTEFGREIGPLASANAPAAIRGRLRSGERGLSDQAPSVKLVFCLREEYYGSLQELSPQFPGLFQDRFRLRSLDSHQAELAIVEPARLQNDGSSEEHFVTPRFEYERVAIDSTLDFLRDKSENIEPVPLQLLCQYIEQVVLESKRKTGTAPYVITAADLGGKKAMKEVIGRFYEDSIDNLPASERRHARELCDTGLLAASGNRLLLEKNQIVKDYKVSEATLRYLTDERRILRPEPRLESTFFEISHDTIARSIFESRKWRLPKQWRRAAAVSVVFMIALGAFAVWALVERSRAVHANAAESSLAKQAQDSAGLAEAATKRARDSLTKSEGMVAFLMGEDFLAKLRPIGKLNVFEDVQKAVPCQRPEKPAGYSDVGLKNLGLACLNEGDIYYGQFRLREASERYETARLHFSELARRKGSGDENLAEALFQEAHVAEDQLDFGRSLDLMRQSLAMQERLVADGARDDKLLRDRATGYVSLGYLREKQDYLRAALASFERALALSAQKDSVEWLYVRENALSGGSEVLAQQGYSERSDAWAREAYDCAKEAVEKSPFAPEAKYQRGVAMSKLPTENQNPEELLRMYQEVFDDVGSAAKWDQENKAWTRDQAATHILMGQQLGTLNRWDDAAEHYRTAIPIVEELLKLDPTNRQLSLDLLVWVYQSLGEVYDKQSASAHEQFLAAMTPVSAGERGSKAREAAAPSPEPKLISAESSRKSKDALDEFFKARERLQQLRAYAPGNVEVSYGLARVALWVAYLQRTDRDAREAIETSERALRELGRPRDPTDGYYWRFKHDLETELADDLEVEGQRAKAEEEFRAAAADIDWLAAHFPPAAETWNAKFDLYCYHIAPFRHSGKDPAGESAAYKQALEAIEMAVPLQARDADLQNNLAFAQQYVGDSLRDSGQFDQALGHYASAEKAWRDAFQLKQSAEYQNRLFLLFYDHIAELRKQQKDEAASRKAYSDSIEPITKAAHLDPKKPVYQSNLALAEQQIGDSFRTASDFAQAQEHYASAEKAWQSALQLGESAEYQNRLFLLFYDHIAEQRKQQKDDAGSRKAYTDALEHITKAAALDPKEPVYQSNLAVVQQQIGDSFRDSGKFEQAEERYRSAESGWRTALKLKESAEYQNRLFLLFYDHITELRKQQKDEAGRRKAYRDALPYVTRAIELEPKEPVYRDSLARAQMAVGNSFGDSGESAQAEEHYRAAVESARQAVALSPKTFDYRVAVSLAFWDLGKIQSDQTGALESFRLAIETLRDALSSEAEASAAQQAYAQSGCYVVLHDYIAPILHKRKDARGEFDALSKARTAALAAVALSRENALYQADLGTAQLGVGDFQWKQGSDPPEALDSYVHAEQAFREAVRLSPKDAEYWSSLARACERQGLVQEDQSQSLAAAKSYRNALSAIEQAMKLNTDDSGKQLHDDLLRKLGQNK